jgi:hypothetical protein
MEKTKSVMFAFTARRIEMALELLEGAIEEMRSKKAATQDAREAAFYDKQTPAFQALVDLLTKTEEAAGKKGATRKARLSEPQFQMLTGSLGQRNLAEVRVAHNTEDGPEKAKRLAALEEWQLFRQDLEAKDPRKFDTSQDAEDDEDEDEDGSDE